MPRIAIVALALSLVFPFIPAALADGHISLSYAENGTGSVATFRATDQDGDDIEWSLNGADKALFTIDGGVLAFKDSPDYEDPKSKSTGTLADRNVYNIDVKATGGTQKVVITVTDVNEDGVVSFDKPQPQVSRGLEASLSDQDKPVSGEKWQWARSSDMETWTDIDKATTANRNPVADDVGSYLRASVTYTDKHGAGQTASAVTDNMVEARTVANAAPSFEDQDDDNNTDSAVEGIQVNRSVNENADIGSSVGKAVSATDADNDILVYSLEPSANIDNADDAEAEAKKFAINSATGQITTKVKFNFESTEGTADRCVNGNSCRVIVRAEDPSGAPATQEVTIAIADANEAPHFTTDSDGTATGIQVPAALNVLEQANNDEEAQLRVGATGDTSLSDTAYAANDIDVDKSSIPGVSNPTQAQLEADAAVTLSGADKKYFTINDDGDLDMRQTLADGTAHFPNYEEKNSYSITVVATSGAGERTLKTTLDVTVHVIDQEDTGKVTLSQREPQVGQTVVAMLSDPDGSISVTKWEWATATFASDACATTWNNNGLITGASSAAYTPKVANYTEDTSTPPNRTSCLQARATYTDGFGTASVTLVGVSDGAIQKSDPANTAPKFTDQDLVTAGDQSDETSRSVAENADKGTNVGNAVTADDADGDLMMLTLGGADADSFKVNNTGQITTNEKFDYETRNTYMVVINAADASGAVDSILVTVNVTDENDPADISGPKAFDYAENGTAPVATFTASDQGRRRHSLVPRRRRRRGLHHRRRLPRLQEVPRLRKSRIGLHRHPCRQERLQRHRQGHRRRACSNRQRHRRERRRNRQLRQASAPGQPRVGSFPGRPGRARQW